MSLLASSLTVPKGARKDHMSHEPNDMGKGWQRFFFYHNLTWKNTFHVANTCTHQVYNIVIACRLYILTFTLSPGTQFPKPLQSPK